MRHRSLAISRAEDLLFGHAPKPLTTRRGMRIGGGLVYPELNFTLPAIEVRRENMPEVERHYREIIHGALLRAAELEAPGVVIEFETVPPLTDTPEFGLGIVDILLQGMEEAHTKHGLPSVLRMTPNDNREFSRPPVMRGGPRGAGYWERMLEVFNGSAARGAELLSIESVGGKELHDEALVACDLGQVIFSLCVLGVRDMSFVWKEFASIARRHGVHAAGDTACGFGNTAMVLAEQKLIPRTAAALVRAVTVVRTLVGYEEGSVGPGKDCGYENPFIKAITGCPMAMEGKTAACAHLSPLGNIAAAYADTWSNESVQNIKLLGGMAPTCYMEQLVYDCRLMNRALAEGKDAARTLQRWLVDSDATLDPQAWILRPEHVIEISQAIVDADSYYHAGVAAARTTLGILRRGVAMKNLRLPEREVRFLDTAEAQLDDLPADEGEFISQQSAMADGDRWIPSEYGI